MGRHIYCTANTSDCTIFACYGRQIISWLADSLRTVTAQSLAPLRTKWDTDLACQLSDGEWEMALLGPTHIPRNSRFKLMQYYILHWAYLTPCKSNKYFNRTYAACPHCRQPDIGFTHMLWSCPSIQPYWAGVVVMRLSRCTGR